MEKKKIVPLKKLVLASLFIALDIIFTRFFSVMIPGVERISLQFLPNALSGFFLGPIWSVAVLIAGDTLGMVINSAGAAYFPGFTLSAALRGLIYGLVLYNHKLKYTRTLVAVAIVSVVVDIGLNPVWMSMLYGKGYLATLVAKLPIRAVFIPAASAIVYFVAKGVIKAVGHTFRSTKNNNTK